MWQTEIGNYGSFSVLLFPLKTEFWKNEKNCWQYHHFTQSMWYGSWDIEWDRQNFLPFWAIFCPFTLLTTWIIIILKKWKKIWRCSHFTFVHQKSWSYDIYAVSSIWKPLQVLQKACIKIVAHAIYTYPFFFLLPTLFSSGTK